MGQERSDRVRQYREDNNPPGSGLAVIANQFSRPSKDDDKKSQFILFGLKLKRLFRDTQAVFIGAITFLLCVLLWRYYVLTSDNSLNAGNPSKQLIGSSFRSGRVEVVDARREVLNPRFFQDFYVAPGQYDETIDLEKGVDADYLTKNIEIALKADGTYTADRMHGRYGYFEDGSPSWKPTPLKRIPQTIEDMEAAWKGFAFNTALADSIPLDRDAPDSRPIGCKMKSDWDYELLPSASVGIVFHNENLAVLLRSVVSILNRTPPHLLREIILVDDSSDLDSHPWLGPQLEDIVDTYPKVRLRRMTERQGLMMARIRAGEWARGDVTVFLDSHIEVTSEWLEPLLETIAQSPKTIVVPRISSIHGETLEFENGGIGAITFSWSLGQVHVPDASSSANFPSPAMAGGLFAANRQFFMDDLGGYDTGLRLYGGEEFELGFKAWMCGGRIEVVPCSRIGHIFRKDTFWKGQVYKVPGHEIARNKRRVAKVWMDEYSDIALGTIGRLPDDMPMGDMSREVAIRERCLDGKPSHSFQWYLDHVATSVWAPKFDDLQDFGAFVNAGHRYCFDSLAGTEKWGVYACHFTGGTQTWLLSKTGELFSASSKFDACGSPHQSAAHGILTMEPCTKNDHGGYWTKEVVDLSNVHATSLLKDDDQSFTIWGQKVHQSEGFLIRNGDNCITLVPKVPLGDAPPTGVSLELLPCDPSNASQVWAVVKD